MKILKYGLLVATMYLFNGCVGQPSIPKVEEAEVGTYEKNYMTEYEKIKKQYENYTPTFRWVQPKNKKEEWRKTKLNDYKWDEEFNFLIDSSDEEYEEKRKLEKELNEKVEFD